MVMPIAIGLATHRAEVIDWQTSGYTIDKMMSMVNPNVYFFSIV